MSVLLINGSPHEKGCTYTALSEVAGELEKNGFETMIYHIGDDPVRGCRGCGHCVKAKFCVIDDDRCNEIVRLMRAAQGVVIGSPVYYSGINGALGALLDRAFYTMYKDLSYKPGAAVVSCRRGGAGCAFDRLNKYFTISNMPVVSSQYWNSVHGNTPDEVRQDAEGLQVMRVLGRNMAWLLKSIEAGNIPTPAPEHLIRTNFIR
ncbi:MAG: flavodoxin family protein [Clostridiales Family XIII bacterium]|jgi:multimeric flavodoxin WrbA|nr:flavodoxin family protein [Clostridiales Family XIII bacterium]